MFHDLMTHHDRPTFEDLFDDPGARRHVAPRHPVAIRPLRAGDVDSVAAVLLGMTPQDRWFRFGRAMPRIDPQMLAMLAAVDGTRHVGVVAVVDDLPVGMAHLVRLRDEPHVAEIAVSVASAHGGDGIGSALVRNVIARAPGLGIEEIECFVVGGNERALRLFRSFGFRFTFDDGDFHARLRVAVVAGAA